MESILRVENLTINFGDEVVIRNLYFEIQKGQNVMIIGPNGAGKTTLFRALMGFIPYDGRVTWQAGIKIGFVPQGVDVNRKFPLTVKELFGFGRVKLTSKDAQAALNLVKTGHLYQRSLASLSSGEFQRVLIAFALAQKPDVLLFDEPTSDIDLGGQETIYHHLEHIAKEHQITLLLISHDLNVVFRYASQVICLNKDLKCQGPPRQVLTPKVLQELYGQETHFYQHAHLIEERHHH